MCCDIVMECVQPVCIPGSWYATVEMDVRRIERNTVLSDLEHDSAVPSASVNCT